MSLTLQEQDVTQLDEFVRAVLLQHGFSDLPEEEQQRLLPSFVEQALVRLGEAVAPKLTEEGVQEFVYLTEDASVTAEDWMMFWKKNVPDFTDIAKIALEQYVVEIQTLITA
jgi:hypothetical protein